MVSIAAFQAVDPGSIPGRRIECENIEFFFQLVLMHQHSMHLNIR